MNLSIYYLGEASVDTMFDNAQWMNFEGNEKCNEPLVLNQHMLKRINPNMKLIVMLRNPIER